MKNRLKPAQLTGLRYDVSGVELKLFINHFAGGVPCTIHLSGNFLKILCEQNLKIRSKFERSQREAQTLLALQRDLYSRRSGTA